MSGAAGDAVKEPPAVAEAREGAAPADAGAEGKVEEGAQGERAPAGAVELVEGGNAALEVGDHADSSRSSCSGDVDKVVDDHADENNVGTKTGGRESDDDDDKDDIDDDGSSMALLAQARALIDGSEPLTAAQHLGQASNSTEETQEISPSSFGDGGRGSDAHLSDQTRETKAASSQEQGMRWPAANGAEDIFLRSTSLDDGEMFSSDLLAETATLMGREPEPAPPAPPSPPTDDPTAASDEATLKVLSSAIQTCQTQELTLVADGTMLHLQDEFLLDSCSWIPVPSATANSAVLALCTQALEDHGFAVRNRQAAQLRFGPTLASEAQSAGSSSADLTGAAESSEASAAQDQTSQSAAGSEQSAPCDDEETESTQTIELGALHEELPGKAEPARKRLAGWANGALKFSMGKLQTALEAVEPAVTEKLAEVRKAAVGRAVAAPVSEDKNQNGDFGSVAIGVDAKTKRRMLVFSGLEARQQHVLSAVVESGAPELEGDSDAVHPDFERDLTAAFRLCMENEIREEVAARERVVRTIEWRAAQMISLVKAGYRAAGLAVPVLERPPTVAQLPLEYPDASDDQVEGANSAEGSLVAQLHAKLAAIMAREKEARRLRKIRQLETREELCARNRQLVITQLRDSEQARGAKYTVALARQMNIPASVVLGSVSAVHDRRPGLLSVTYGYLLFAAKVLGFRKQLCVPLTTLAGVRLSRTKGAASFVGDAALVAHRHDGSELTFITTSVLDAERLRELVSQVTAMQMADAAQPAKSSPTSESGSFLGNSTLSTTSGHNGVLDRSDSGYDSGGSDHSALPSEAGAPAASTASADELDADRRLMEMKKMMASTVLGEDEEHF